MKGSMVFMLLITEQRNRMKFDTIIIGGGLSGLTCGIRLAEQGKKCAIISMGQSALHFFSGSFDLLGYTNGNEVTSPLAVIPTLPAVHPYARMGIEAIKSQLKEVKPLLMRAGIKVHGAHETNHYRLTPIGVMKPTWLSLDDFTCFDNPTELPWKKIAVLNLAGFLDFHAQFIAEGLTKLGAECTLSAFSLEELERIRRNPSEMRSSNIAKVFESEKTRAKLIEKIKAYTEASDCIVFPSVFGLFSPHAMEDFRAQIQKPLCLISAIPPSVSGIRTQLMLRQRFQELGGTYMLGDTVKEGVIEGDKVHHILTHNHGDIKMEATTFVLSTGSFFSHGLVADPYSIFEPIFGLDVEGPCDDNRQKWYDEQLFNKQPYLSFGVSTDSTFKAKKDGLVIDNLYVSGSVLGGCDPLKESCGAGVSILTSLQIADEIVH